MKKHERKYSDEPLGEVEIITDFLPSPDELVARDETVKVTLLLTKSSVDFFKNAANKHHTQYQKMIRSLLDFYVSHYAK